MELGLIDLGMVEVETKGVFTKKRFDSGSTGINSHTSMT